MRVQSHGLRFTDLLLLFIYGKGSKITAILRPFMLWLLDKLWTSMRYLFFKKITYQLPLTHNKNRIEFNR